MITRVTHECPSCHKVVEIEVPEKGNVYDRPKGWSSVSFNDCNYKVICNICVFKIKKAVPYLKDLPLK